MVLSWLRVAVGAVLCAGCLPNYDGLTGGGTGGSSSRCGSQTSERRVFVTSKTYEGNFAASAGNGSAVEIADSLCQGAAQSATDPLGGQWIAWLSEDGLDAIDRFTSLEGPWVNLEGSIALAYADLTDGNHPTKPIDLNEDCKPISDSAKVVWTGTKSDGTVQPHPTDNKVLLTCDSWSTKASNAEGRAGHAVLDLATGGSDKEDWTSAETLTCNQRARLYCFEKTRLR